MLQQNLSGQGWLRAPQFGSAARYRIDGSSGSLQCELTTMIEVRAAGRGTLILDDGSRLDVCLTGLANGEATFAVLASRQSGPHTGRPA